MKVSYIRPAYARFIVTADIDVNDFAEWYNDTISDEPCDIDDIFDNIDEEMVDMYFQDCDNDKLDKIEDRDNAELITYEFENQIENDSLTFVK